MGYLAGGRAVGHALLRVARASSLAAVLTLTAAAPVSALTILPRFVGLSDAEQAVFMDAIGEWEALLRDSHVVSLEIAKTDLPALILGQTSGLTAGADGLPAAARIEFGESGGGLGWYLDPDLADGSDFVAGKVPFYERAARGSDAALRFDLFSLANHELAHALGFSTEYDDFADRVVVGTAGARTFVGDSITIELSPAGTGTHLSDADRFDLMSRTLSAGERRTVSYVDLLMLHDAFGYDIAAPVEPPPPPVPEPTLGLLLMAGALAAVTRTRRRSMKSRRIDASH